MLIVRGKKISDSTREYSRKDGSKGQIREIAINEGRLHNTIIGVPVNAKIEVDKDGSIEIVGVRAVSKVWSVQNNKYEFKPVSLYLPDDMNR